MQMVVVAAVVFLQCIFVVLIHACFHSTYFSLKCILLGLVQNSFAVHISKYRQSETSLKDKHLTNCPRSPVAD